MGQLSIFKLEFEPHRNAHTKMVHHSDYIVTARNNLMKCAHCIAFYTYTLQDNLHNTSQRRKSREYFL